MTDIVALIVAVEKCGQPSWDLPGARSKALEVVQILLDMGAKNEDIFLFMRFEKGDRALEAQARSFNVQISPPTLEGIDTRFSTIFKHRQPNSRLFCYWYGHGYADAKGNKILICDDFDLEMFSHRVFNATNRLRRLQAPNYKCFSQQIFLADVCGQKPRSALGLDEVDLGNVRPGSRQLAFFAAREGGYSDGTFSTVLIKELKPAHAWIEPHLLFQKLVPALESAAVEPYVISVYDERERIESWRFGLSGDESIYLQVPHRDLLDASWMYWSVGIPSCLSSNVR